MYSDFSTHHYMYEGGPHGGWPRSRELYLQTFYAQGSSVRVKQSGQHKHRNRQCKPSVSYKTSNCLYFNCAHTKYKVTDRPYNEDTMLHTYTRTHAHYKMMQPFFFLARGLGHKTARIASSNTVFSPFCVSAEHSRYLTAPISLAIARPCG